MTLLLTSVAAAARHEGTRTKASRSIDVTSALTLGAIAVTPAKHRLTLLQDRRPAQH
jgi:hypothetical protein